MIIIFGQMEPASRIFEHVFLGTEWNASNLDELRRNNVKYIINVTQEIENFFPNELHYTRVPLLDEPDADLLSHWEETFRVLQRAKHEHASALVHCQMGISRSASTVIAYAMKANRWLLDRAFAYVKERRPIVKPNQGFWTQLHVYEGILRANRRSWLSQPQAPHRKQTVREYLDEVGLGAYAAELVRTFPTVDDLRAAPADQLALCRIPPSVARVIARSALPAHDDALTEQADEVWAT
jgi:hypothetical protein